MWPETVYGGTTLAGHSIGILTIRTRSALLPGNPQHARSFDQPVLYEEVVTPDGEALMRGDPQLSGPIVAAARRLQAGGVKAVVGACGSFAYYQQAVADALDVPVFMSILLQVPLLQRAIGPRKKLGIICAAAYSMNERVFDQCGIETTSNLVIREMKGYPEFDRLMGEANPHYPHQLCDEVVDLANRMIDEEPRLAGFLLQCSDLPPFAPAIQQATGRPVFDMTVLIRSLQAAMAYPPYR